MGEWIGGQADYVMVPYADFNLLNLICDLTCLSDILPTGFHGAVTAKVGVGSTVYVAGAGPVGLAAAASARRKAKQRLDIHGLRRLFPIVVIGSLFGVKSRCQPRNNV
jgi:threonine dehydrogenase-like Zn-dependent dehydrogenase